MSEEFRKTMKIIRPVRRASGITAEDQAQIERDMAESKKPGEPLTVKDHAEQLVHDTAEIIRWASFGTKQYRESSESSVRNDLWQTPQGKALRILWQSFPDSTPAEAAAEVRKMSDPPAELVEGLRVLREGFPLPKS